MGIFSTETNLSFALNFRRYLELSKFTRIFPEKFILQNYMHFSDVNDSYGFGFRGVTLNAGPGGP